ncbi:hypothetical protein [Anabaena azotica]|uniref:hypothetical protein n=1 Tax=Anabaena azotica TaxID=197653 RepID=UPI0039A51798
MEIDLILNELSLENPASDKQTARQWMSNFINTIKALHSQGVKVYLRTKDNFKATILAYNAYSDPIVYYPIGSWLDDNEVRKEEIDFILTLATGSPFSKNIPNPEIEGIENNEGLSEFCYEGKVALGLGIAYVLDTLAISFISDMCWDASHIELDQILLSDGQEIIDQKVEIRHASRKNNIQYHSEWIQKQIEEDKIQEDILDGNDIWDRREELFPNLEFCENVGKQIQGLDYGTPILQQVKKKLFKLQNYCQTWTEGDFNLDLLPSKATPESQSRLDSLEEKLTFKCPDTKKRIFSLHIRMTPGAWRLHFSTELGICPELGTGKIIIGYIGEKIQ